MPARISFTDVQIDQIRTLYRGGQTMEEIAKALDTSFWAIRRALRDIGEESRPRGHRIESDAWATAVADGAVETRYTAGESIQKLAKQYGVAMATVHKHLKSLGVDTRRRGPKRLRTGTHASCRTCKQALPIEEFYGYSGRLQKGPDALVPDCKACMRDNLRVRLYGVSRQQYLDMLKAQGGRCAICGRTADDVTSGDPRQKELSVDHCHATGKVRALLCAGCNTGLGKFFDNPDLMEKAARYVRDYQTKNPEA